MPQEENFTSVVAKIEPEIREPKIELQEVEGPQNVEEVVAEEVMVNEQRVEEVVAEEAMVNEQQVEEVVTDGPPNIEPPRAEEPVTAEPSVEEQVAEPVQNEIPDRFIFEGPKKPAKPPRIGRSPTRRSERNRELPKDRV